VQPVKNSVLKEDINKMLKTRQKQVTHSCIVVVLMVLLAFGTFNSGASAQPTLSLSINKIFGYQYGSVLSGSFVVNTKVSEDVDYVEIYSNGTLQANDTEAPFTWTANTVNYPVGNFNITAVAYGASEQKAVSTISETFIEMPYLGPTLILVLIIVVIFVVIPVICAWYMAKRSKTK
jgi:hypothetical protein